MVGNPCLPSVAPMNETVRLWMKLDCHVHASFVLCTDTVVHHYLVGMQ